MGSNAAARAAFLAGLFLFGNGRADEPVPEPVLRGTYVETREDTPGVMFIHRNGQTIRVTRIADDSAGHVRLQGPAEIAVKWDPPVAPGSEPWPPGVSVVATNALCAGIQRIEVTGSAASAAALLAALPQVRYAYPVEFQNPLFSRLIPTDQVIVKLAAGVTIGQLTGAFAVDPVAPLIGSTTEYVMRLRFPKTTTARAMADALGTSGLVDWAERDCLRDVQFHYTPTDPRFTSQWHLNATGQNISGFLAPTNFDLNVTSAWDVTLGSTNVFVAVIDTGVDTNHPDLAANLTTNGAYDFYGSDYIISPDDPNLDQHGTAVAGVVGAIESNGIGVVGVAPRCPMVPIKIAGSGNFPFDSDVANSVRQGADYADIVNCSWGYFDPATAVVASVQYALQQGAGGRGSVVFFAAGNEAGFTPSAITFGGAGNYEVRFRYSKDASGSGGLDQCFVDSLFLPNGAAESFDALTVPALPAGYSSGGGAWTSIVEFLGMRPESGAQFVGSPPIGDNQSTYVQFTVNSPAAGSQLFYWMRVDAEPTIYDTNGVGTVFDAGQVEFRTAGIGAWTTNNFQGGPGCAVSYPAANPEPIAVGACDTFGRRTHYSSWGPSLDFVAPSAGDFMLLGVETTDIVGTNGYSPSSYCGAVFASKFTGTSSTTPMAAGIGALIRSLNPNLSPSQVRNIMRASCYKLDPAWYTYSGRMGGRCDYVGWGELDAAAALSLAAATPAPTVFANSLKITEVSPVDARCPFVEIFNASPGIPFALENLMLTDGETGGEITGGAFQFLPGTVIPPLGTVVLALGQANTSLVAELTGVVAGGGAMPGGLQLFECVTSGLQFNGLPIGQMQAHALPAGFVSGGSNNFALVITPGMAASFLPDVVDGMTYGQPTLASGGAFGVGPGVVEGGPYASGGTATNSYQRNGALDTDRSGADFTATKRTPGRIVFGQPVQTLRASPLSSIESALRWSPPTPGATVLITSSSDANFSYPVHGSAYLPGMMIGADRVVYFGTATAAVDAVGMPSTLRYYAAWVVDAATNYSGSAEASATTLPPPRPLPLVDDVPGPGLNATSWPYASDVTIDTALALAPPSAPNTLRLSGTNGSAELASTVFNAMTNVHVHLVYRYQQGGLADAPEPGDDLIVELLNPARMWMPLAIHPAAGPGAGFFATNRIVLPGGLLHNQLRVRFRTTGVSTGPTDTDDWFLDDIALEEFPVLSGFAWGAMASPQSVGVPFQVSLTALSSFGGTLTNYAGPALLQLFAEAPGENLSFSPPMAQTFVSGVWSNPAILMQQPVTSLVHLVALDGAVIATSTLFQVLSDADADGMPDAWEYGWFGNLTTASNAPPGDFDGDGWTDPDEFVADTCPTNALSFFPLLTVTNPPAGTLTLQIDPTSTARVYEVRGTTNLPALPQQWTLHGDAQTGSGTSVVFIVTNDAPHRIYRTGVRLP